MRAAAVYALGTFISSSSERTTHANNTDHGVAMTLVGVVHDASPIVRRVSPPWLPRSCVVSMNGLFCLFQELVVALSGLITQFEIQFVAVAQQHMEEERSRDHGSGFGSGELQMIEGNLGRILLV